MHSARLTGLGLIAIFLLGLGLGDGPTPPSPLEPSLEPWVAPDWTYEAPPIDTLRPTVEVGTPLILALPSELDAAPVDRYSLIRGPSLSGVVDHSFTWIPHSVEPDTYDVLLQASRPDAPPDTLLVRVEVQK